MKKQTNKGFSITEFIIILCTLLVLLAIGIKVLSDNTTSGNYSIFKKQASNFANKVSIYKDMYPREDNMYYLNYLFDDGYALELTNPFDDSTNCDQYESYVKISNSKKYVTLKCGEYLAIGIDGDDYSIYKLSDWSEEELNGESMTLYNYKKNGKVASENYMIEREFVAYYNLKEDKSIIRAEDVDDEELLTKKMYREKKFIKVV